MTGRTVGRRRRISGMWIFVGFLTIAVIGAVIADYFLLGPDRPDRLMAPQSGRTPGVFARSAASGEGVSLPIGGPELLVAHETPPDLDIVHKIDGGNAEETASASPAGATPTGSSKAGTESSGRWFVGSNEQYALPPQGSMGGFSSPVGGFRGFPGGIGTGSAKASGSASRHDS